MERARRPIAAAIDRSGTLLDVGCANGLLMESLAGWTSKEGFSIEPYGLELIPSLVALAQGRLPEWSGRISVGSVMAWRPPFRFDFVRAELEYVPQHRRPSMVRCLLDEYVVPGGRLILCSYGSSGRPGPKAEPVAELLATRSVTSPKPPTSTAPSLPVSPGPTATRSDLEPAAQACSIDSRQDAWPGDISPNSGARYTGILVTVEKLKTASFELEEERVAWEGLAASCAGPIRRLGSFFLVGFVFFVAATTAVVLFYNLFGDSYVDGAGVTVPQGAFYTTMLLGLVLAVGGYLVWLIKSLYSYRGFRQVLLRGGVDPERPTAEGLRAYSDEQILEMRSRYERMPPGKFKGRLERTFGFHKGDSFSLGPLSVLPGTFEMGSLRVEWETQLILRSGEPIQPVGWWAEGRRRLLPRKPDEISKLVYTLRYTDASVRELKRRYGYRTDRWYATVPEGKLFEAVRDLETSQRIHVTLGRRSPVS